MRRGVAVRLVSQVWGCCAGGKYCYSSWHCSLLSGCRGWRVAPSGAAMAGRGRASDRAAGRWAVAEVAPRGGSPTAWGSSGAYIRALGLRGPPRRLWLHAWGPQRLPTGCDGSPARRAVPRSPKQAPRHAPLYTHFFSPISFRLWAPDNQSQSPFTS